MAALTVAQWLGLAAVLVACAAGVWAAVMVNRHGRHEPGSKQ